MLQIWLFSYFLKLRPEVAIPLPLAFLIFSQEFTAMSSEKDFGECFSFYTCPDHSND